MVKRDMVLDLPPSIGNPRNSEGAFIDLQDGRILFVYSRFTGRNYYDDSIAAIAAVFSADGGNTWSDYKVIAEPGEHNALNIMSVSLLRMLNGDIGLFYIIRYGWHDSRLYVRRSSDEGKTWGEAVCCIPSPGYYVTNNDRVVRLKTGRLILPVSYHRMRGESEKNWNTFDSRGIACFYLSDDDGVTWREARNYCNLSVAATSSGLQEPGVVELKNGVLWAWARTDLGRQYEMMSVDMGESWSMPVPSIFTSPCSPLSMKKINDEGWLFAVWNPIPNYQTRELEKHSWGRIPLVGAISRDNGVTWGKYITIEGEDTGGGYCYTAIHFHKNSVLLAYCAGQAEDGICLARLRICKLNLSEIT